MGGPKNHLARVETCMKRGGESCRGEGQLLKSSFKRRKGALLGGKE